MKEFIDFIRDTLGYAPDTISPGRIVRFHTDNRNKLNGWAKLFPTLDYGVFGDWSHGQERVYSWRKDGARRELSPTEKRAIKNEIRKAKEEEKRARREAFEAMLKEADNLCPITEASDLSYLSRKGLLETHGILWDKTEDSLAFKFYNQDGMLMGFERIFPDGSKKICKGSRKKGAFAIVGYRQDAPPKYACEGWATACSIQEATNENIIVCIDAGNLTDGIKSACSYFEVSPSTITIVADNDASKKGEEFALEASRTLGCSVRVVPVMGMDANDYAKEYGVTELRKWIERG